MAFSAFRSELTNPLSPDRFLKIKNLRGGCATFKASHKVRTAKHNVPAGPEIVSLLDAVRASLDAAHFSDYSCLVQAYKGGRR